MNTESTNLEVSSHCWRRTDSENANNHFHFRPTSTFYHMQWETCLNFFGKQWVRTFDAVQSGHVRFVTACRFTVCVCVCVCVCVYLLYSWVPCLLSLVFLFALWEVWRSVVTSSNFQGFVFVTIPGIPAWLFVAVSPPWFQFLLISGTSGDRHGDRIRTYPCDVMSTAHMDLRHRMIDLMIPRGVWVTAIVTPIDHNQPELITFCNRHCTGTNQRPAPTQRSKSLKKREAPF